MSIEIDSATGFALEECHSADPLVGTFWMAYPDERVIYHLHRSNCGTGETREKAITSLLAKQARRIAA